MTMVVNSEDNCLLYIREYTMPDESFTPYSWKFISEFKTKEEAQEHFELLWN